MSPSPDLPSQRMVDWRLQRDCKIATFVLECTQYLDEGGWEDPDKLLVEWAVLLPAQGVMSTALLCFETPCKTCLIPPPTALCPCLGPRWEKRAVVEHGLLLPVATPGGEWQQSYSWGHRRGSWVKGGRWEDIPDPRNAERLQEMEQCISRLQEPTACFIFP